MITIKAFGSRVAGWIIIPFVYLGITRDSPWLKYGVIASGFTILTTLPASNPLLWHRVEWLTMGAWVFGILSAQMGTSRLAGKNDLDNGK